MLEAVYLPAPVRRKNPTIVSNIQRHNAELRAGAVSAAVEKPVDVWFYDPETREKELFIKRQ